MIFVDTSAWYALVVAATPEHQAIREVLAQLSLPLLTTDYVVDETLTLLRARGHSRLALTLGQEFFSDTLATIYHLNPADVRATWQVFQRYADKDWSFTDCASKVVMEQLRITQALSLDHHFRQFGNVSVLP